MLGLFCSDANALYRTVKQTTTVAGAVHTCQLVKCKKTKHVKWFNTVRSNKASPREPLKKP